MILVFSDLHLGRRPDVDAAILQDLEACVGSFHEAKRVVFLGDVFDAYIDYPGYNPRTLERWTASVNKLLRSGLDVSVHAGNHDRWHASTIEDRTSITPIRDPEVLHVGGRKIHLTHGDRVDSHGALTHLARLVSDAEWAYRAYSAFLPARAGNGLAAAVSRRFADMEPSDSTVEALMASATALLKRSDLDVVVYGHCHKGQLLSVPSGVYLNAGDWHASRSFGIVETDRVRLMSWVEGSAMEADSTRYPTTNETDDPLASAEEEIPETGFQHV